MTIIDEKFIKTFKIKGYEDKELSTTEVVALIYLVNRYLPEVEYILVNAKNLVSLKYNVLDVCIKNKTNLLFYKKVQELFKHST